MSVIVLQNRLSASQYFVQSMTQCLEEKFHNIFSFSLDYGNSWCMLFFRVLQRFSKFNQFKDDLRSCSVKKPHTLLHTTNQYYSFLITSQVWTFTSIHSLVSSFQQLMQQELIKNRVALSLFQFQELLSGCFKFK